MNLLEINPFKAKIIWNKVINGLGIHCFAFLLVISFSFGQETESNPEKLFGSISLKYETQNDPIRIEYEAHSYGGSGNYLYQWGTKSDEFENYGDSSTYVQEISCTNLERPEITVLCQIKDISTGKTHLIVLKHPVEYCQN